MQTKFWKIFLAFTAAAFLLVFAPSSQIFANSVMPSDGPQRKAVMTVSYIAYEWWLLSWQSPDVLCQVFVEHEGWPVADEVQYYCGNAVLQRWQATKPCATTPDQCAGLYLHLAGSKPGEREVEVDLLPPTVWVSITDCDPVAPENRCETLPGLLFKGEEPLPNESIIAIQGYVDNQPFSCQGSECRLPLPPTGENGVRIVFWAVSSFGDNSKRYDAQVRLIAVGDFPNPDESSMEAPLWYIDLISSQYLGQTSSTCSQIWQSFPPVGGAAAWLQTPERPEDLSSNRPYYFLAGSLISQDIVDAADCENGGLAENGAANQCGLETARVMVDQWQNQFNAEIIQVAVDTGVPAQLMKNIFSRESQFWPGIYSRIDEAGLGHLSDLGADTVLLWNPAFFSQFCPLVLDTILCQRGFGNLDVAEQELLRGALVQKVNATCPNCPMGIDLTQANFSISVFARSLLANCEQVGQIIYNTTQVKAGEVATYEDLWRFTLVNYNAGPGCLAGAIQKTCASGLGLTWENVAANLDLGCQTALDYIADISSIAPPTPADQLEAVPEEVLAEPTPEPVEPTPTQIIP